MRKHRPIWLSAAGIVVLLLAACAPKPAPTPVPTTPASTPVAAAPTAVPVTPAPAARPATPAATPAPATPAATPAPTTKLPAVMSVATAGVGTTSYIAGSAFAEVLNKYAGTKLSVEPSGATSRWIPLMKKGEIDVAIGCSLGDVKDAYFGQYYWKDQGGAQPINQVAIGQVQPYGFNVTDPNIKSIADLKGKKVYGYIKGMRQQNDSVDIVLRESGLKPGDVEVLTFSDINEAAKGIQEGKSVGVYYLPTVLPIVELDRSKPLYAVPTPKEVVQKIMEVFPELGFMTWKKGEGIAKYDVPYVAQPCGMTGRANLDPNVLYTFLDTIYAHYDDYKDKHPIMKFWTPQQATSIIASPVHPGAIKYFKEKGVWTAEQERQNQKLLALPKG